MKYSVFTLMIIVFSSSALRAFDAPNNRFNKAKEVQAPDKKTPPPSPAPAHAPAPAPAPTSGSEAAQPRFEWSTSSKAEFSTGPEQTNWIGCVYEGGVYMFEIHKSTVENCGGTSTCPKITSLTSYLSDSSYDLFDLRRVESSVSSSAVSEAFESTISITKPRRTVTLKIKGSEIKKATSWNTDNNEVDYMGCQMYRWRPTQAQLRDLQPKPEGRRTKFSKYDGQRQPFNIENFNTWIDLMVESDCNGKTGGNRFSTKDNTDFASRTLVYTDADTSKEGTRQDMVGVKNVNGESKYSRLSGNVPVGFVKSTKRDKTLGLELKLEKRDESSVSCNTEGSYEPAKWTCTCKSRRFSPESDDFWKCVHQAFISPLVSEICK